MLRMVPPVPGRDRGEPAGYIALRDMRMGEFRTLALVDLFCDPARADVSAALLRAAHQMAVELDVALAKTKAMRDMLEAMTSCRCRKLEQCAQGLERNRQRWHLSASPKPRTKPR